MIACNFHTNFIACIFVGDEAFVEQKPGICFTEKMVGKFIPSSNTEEQISCEFTLTIESDHVERMIKWDPDHVARISGTVSCSELSPAPMMVSEGKFFEIHIFHTCEILIDYLTACQVICMLICSFVCLLISVCLFVLQSVHPFVRVFISYFVHSRKILILNLSKFYIYGKAHFEFRRKECCSGLLICELKD